MHQPFAILIDATCHTSNNEIPEEAILQLLGLMPPEMAKNFCRLYIYNMNTAYRKYFRKTLRAAVKDKVCAHSAAEKEYIVLGSDQELKKHFDFAHLPKETASFSSDTLYISTPVTKLSKSKGETEVHLKIGTQYIQITPVKKVELLPGYRQTVPVNDIYRIADVDEVQVPIHYSDIENSFGIKVENGRQVLHFSSPKKNEILKVLKASKLKSGRNNREAQRSERTIRPEDVPGTMLNISLMNMGNLDPNLRLSAYNLLCAMCDQFKFSLDGQSVAARGLSIPPEAITLIVGLSEKLATSEPQLTFDFLTEFFIGWEKSQPDRRALNVRYMAPWLGNLYTHVLMGSEDAEKNKERLAQIARKIIDITIQERRLYTAFQQDVWTVIGKDEGLLDVFLDELIRAANNFGFGSEGSEIIGSICACFGIVTIRSKVITKLRKALNRTSLRATRDLVDNPVWNEICVLLKICLAISFDSRIQAQMFLAELFHVITMVVNCGTIQVKNTVHSLLVNTVHSIATSFPLEEGNMTKLKEILNQLNEPKMCLLFGLNRPTPRDPSMKPGHRTSEYHTTSTTMEQITMLLLEIISVAAPTTDLANIWRARWMSLVASTAFQSNPAIQPRAFAVMGCLAREDVDDDLLYQVLVVLKNALTRFHESGDEEILTAIITSLTKMMDNLSPASRYLQQLFWVAISLVRLGSGAIFNCSSALLEATLRTLNSCGDFVGNRMIPVLIRGQSSSTSIGMAAREIDELYGIRFTADNFHFALAITMMRGLQTSSTKAAAIRTLTTFIEIGRANATDTTKWGVDIPIPQYLSTVVARASNTSEIKELLWMVGINIDDHVDISSLTDTTTTTSSSPTGTTIAGSPSTSIWSIFPPMESMDEANLLLTGVLALIDFKSCEESIQRHALVFFTQMARRRPDVFAVLYEHLVDYVDVVLNTSHNTVLLREANLLMCQVSRNHKLGVGSSGSGYRGGRERLERFLEDWGLRGVWGSSTFKGTAGRESECAKLTDRLIEVSLE